MEVDRAINISSGEEVKNQSDSSVFLPKDILLLIFEKLPYEDLCRAGQVCKYWSEVRQYPTLNRKIVINISRHSQSLAETALEQLRLLPSYVTHLKTNFEHAPEEWGVEVDNFLHELSVNCPNLRTLIFHRVTFIVDRYKDKNKLPSKLRVLALHCSDFNNGNYIKSADFFISPNIEVLDYSRCTQAIIRPWDLICMRKLKKLRIAGSVIADYFYQHYFYSENRPFRLFEEDIFPASLLIQLEVLDLECTMINSETFFTISRVGFNLKELYVCVTLVRDVVLMSLRGKVVFPCLETICLRNCDITAVGVKELIKACPSIVHIYVGSEYMKDENSYIDLKSEKVHLLTGFHHCNHYEKVDYFDE